MTVAAIYKLVCAPSETPFWRVLSSREPSDEARYIKIPFWGESVSQMMIPEGKKPTLVLLYVDRRVCIGMLKRRKRSLHEPPHLVERQIHLRKFGLTKLRHVFAPLRK
jgi:hypothetical protein